MLLKIGGVLFDVAQLTLSILDVGSDIAVMVEFHQDGRMPFFYCVLTTLILTSIACSICFLARANILSSSNPCTWLAALLISPFGLLLPPANFVMTRWCGWEPDRYQSSGYKIDWTTVTKELQEKQSKGTPFGRAAMHVFAKAGVESAHNALGVLDNAVTSRFMSFLLLNLQCVTESAPQICVQLVAISLTESGKVTTLQIVSLSLSLFAILSKCFFLARSFDVAAFVAKLSFAAFDLFSVAFLFSVLLGSNASKDHHLFGSSEFQVNTVVAPWLYLLFLCTAVWLVTLLVGWVVVIHEESKCSDRISITFAGLTALAVLSAPAILCFEAAKFMHLVFANQLVSPYESELPHCSLLHCWLWGGSGGMKRVTYDWRRTLKVARESALATIADWHARFPGSHPSSWEMRPTDGCDMSLRLATIMEDGKPYLSSSSSSSSSDTSSSDTAENSEAEGGAGDGTAAAAKRAKIIKKLEERVVSQEPGMCSRDVRLAKEDKERKAKFRRLRRLERENNKEAREKLRAAIRRHGQWMDDGFENGCFYLRQSKEERMPDDFAARCLHVRLAQRFLWIRRMHVGGHKGHYDYNDLMQHDGAHIYRLGIAELLDELDKCGTTKQSPPLSKLFPWDVLASSLQSERDFLVKLIMLVYAFTSVVTSIYGIIFPFLYVSLFGFEQLQTMQRLTFSMTCITFVLTLCLLPAFTRYHLTCLVRNKFLYLGYTESALATDTTTTTLAVINSYSSLPITVLTALVPAPVVPEDALLRHVCSFLTPKQVGVFGVENIDELRRMEDAAAEAPSLSYGTSAGDAGLNDDADAVDHDARPSAVAAAGAALTISDDDPEQRLLT